VHSAVYDCVVSVCPSVTLVHCVETTELIIKQLAVDCSVGTLSTDTKHETIGPPDPPLSRRGKKGRGGGTGLGEGH